MSTPRRTVFLLCWAALVLGASACGDDPPTAAGGPSAQPLEQRRDGRERARLGAAVGFDERA